MALDVKDFEPEKFEGKLLRRYLIKTGGLLILEVPIGSKGGSVEWPEGSKTRFIDGILIVNALAGESQVFKYQGFGKKAFCKETEGRVVEVIEVKDKLNRVVFGQALAGVDMFEAQYNASFITPVVVCHEPDPAMELVCTKHGVRVEIIDLENNG